MSDDGDAARHKLAAGRGDASCAMQSRRPLCRLSSRSIYVFYVTTTAWADLRSCTNKAVAVRAPCPTLLQSFHEERNKEKIYERGSNENWGNGPNHRGIRVLKICTI